MKNPQSSLPPGFRFHPTDEELILHYLQKKVSSVPLPVSIIAEVDIYKFDPWDLPDKAAFGEKEWYFFSPRDRKYPNGARPNRAAASGYWKATGTDKVIMASSSMGARNTNIGVKKALVFYKGRPPKGAKTNWIMHEYRLTESPCTLNSINRPSRLKDSSMRLDDWVLCRIYKKSNVPSPAMAVTSTDQDQEEEERFFGAQDAKLPGLASLPSHDIGLASQKSSSFPNLLDPMDYAMLSSFLFDSGTQPNSPACLEPSESTLTQGVAQNDPLLHQYRLPAASGPAIENALKRQRSCFEAEMNHPSKTAFPGSTFDVPGQYNYMFNNAFLNQQLLLSPNVHFLG